MKKRDAVIALVTSILATGCATDKAQRTQELGGLATVSALAVALPLLPVVGAYRALSGSVEHAKQRAEEARKVFEPVYEKRIAMIRERNPIADARGSWQRGDVAFLPAVEGNAFYPGLEKTEFQLQDREQNSATISRSELLSYLVRLADRDPSEPTENGVHYPSQVYDTFRQVASAYKKAFNSEMYRLRKGGEPNQSTDSTAASVTVH